MAKRLNELTTGSIAADTMMAICASDGQLKKTTIADLKQYMFADGSLSSLLSRVEALEQQMENTLDISAVPAQPDNGDDDGGLAG